MFKVGDKVRVKTSAKTTLKSISVWKSGVYDPYLSRTQENLVVEFFPSAEIRCEGILLDVIVKNNQGTWFVNSDILELDVPEKTVIINGVEYSESTAQKAMEAYVKGHG